MDDFSSARPGDKLYSLKRGEVTVHSIANCGSIKCALDIPFILEWLPSGLFDPCDATQDLYWSKPEIIAPPRPKRMVEKKYEFWVNVYPSGTYSYSSKIEADSRAKARLGEAEHIVRTVMEEE